MSEPLYRPVDPGVSFPQLETEVAARWRKGRVFQRSLEQREGRPEWVFYEGPPTANGKPGLHHVEPRIFKDVYCRFQAMNGHYVHRKGGWDCHGLPVEIEVEKQLGITQKRQIEEEVGIEEFTRLCRESVKRYVDEWERFTERIGFWLDLDEAYWTMDPEYVETVWWILKQIWDKGLLEEDFKVVPYCPRCETSLSSHEQHQTGAYKMVSDPSVYVRYPLVDQPRASLLVWTTTPWTLLANMAVAVGEEISYVRVADPSGDGELILARERVEPLLGDGVEVLDEVSGAELLGLRYEPPFGFVEPNEVAHTVRPGDFVTTTDGSGIVHLAPYGEDDMVVAKRDDLPITQMIDPSGRVVPTGGPFAGRTIQEANPLIIEDLQARSLLFRAEDYEHSYPHCWRCQTPLLYYPRLDWYIRTSQIRSELQASNEETNWQPPTIKYGRFGDWLANNVDWSLSRDRYWGTPLPIWRCEQQHATCVGSFAELAELAGRGLGEDFDPHRPHVDEITIKCPHCGEEAARVASVIDTWFDSGSMPFGQWHYPFENEEVFEHRFPADFISEAIDQTRGWFYSLLAVATLVRGQNSYRNVVCLGHIVDAEGKKMSKSIGNVIDPWEVLENQGADPLRWYMLTSGTPWSARRVSIAIIEESLRKYLLTLWNTYSFWVTYASLEGYDPSDQDIPVTDRSEMDRWILAELNDTIGVVTASMEAFDATTGGRRLDRFVDDLSNWYVRRCRRRFWRSGEDADTRAAFQTLWECLATTAKLSAPFTPFVSDEIFTNLVRADAADSVHLSDWPTQDASTADEGLRKQMALVRKLVTLGRSARSEAKVRVRQPLQRALIVVPAAETEALGPLEALVAEELNVKTLEHAAGLGELVSYTVKPNFKALGPRFGSRVKNVAQVILASDPAQLVNALETEGVAHVDVDGEQVSLGPEDVDVRVQGRSGFSLVQDGPYGVALDLELTPELVAEGVAREVVRAVQELRKTSGLAVEDRINLWLGASDEFLTSALATHLDTIAAEVLAIEAAQVAEVPEQTARDRVALDQGTVDIALRRA
jgi:isoleucyl-tRNA synthetase